MREPYDLLLTGGEVLDPGGGQHGRLDVAVRGGLIADVGPALPRHAHDTLDVTGDLVLPGLVDLHTHIYPGAGYWGIDPDPTAWHTGVTTWVDAGSAGAYTVAGLRDFAASRRVRVHALLNIAGQGLSARTGEGVDLTNCDVEQAVRAIREHRDLVRGVKVRIDQDTVGDNGVEPLRRALTAAQECGVPVMVHIGTTPPALAEVLELLRPGDILTHCASGIAQPTGPEARAAHERGVLFDVGHGSGAFAFDVAEAQLADGMPPHTISTDLHARSVYGPVFDLPTTMAKLIAAGLPLDEVVASVTIRPARALGLQAGTLAPGSPADVAVFTLDDRPQELTDAHRQTRTVPFRLVNRHTYVGGRRLNPALPAPPPPWVPLTAEQTTALRERENAVRDLLATPLVGVNGLAEQFPRPLPRPR
ncbi:amidohydrolase/deacetylase family metallohydrolase [Actinoplanes sp. NBRC 103695]|uniref:amidohydrolase/deacetylase family metallohydrolase n=1 Tax=Actinoplanes sp. NBRC 103695 TaxID=3032202 RepID=UPI0024A40903|nr:amidohydrolase/deacetylase family metallohydrolase [Actinoplanes sp. NBRC 103695]GLY96045.1 amidohydrolase [Actinoplanes sp. NBRC 103695]